MQWTLRILPRECGRVQKGIFVRLLECYLERVVGLHVPSVGVCPSWCNNPTYTWWYSSTCTQHKGISVRLYESYINRVEGYKTVSSSGRKNHTG